MHDPRAVRRGERVGDLRAQGQHARDRQRLAPDPVLERLPFEPFHHDERPPLVLADVVDRTDVRMVQRGGRLRLPLEPLERRPARCDLLGEELDRHMAAQAGVLGVVHDAHAPAAELGHDPIVRDGRADHRTRAGTEPF